MSIVTNGNLNKYFQQIKNLKEEFVKKYNSGESTEEIIGKMRQIHGQAIFEDTRNKFQLAKNNKLNPSDFYNLSVDYCTLANMDKKIRHLEILQFERKHKGFTHNGLDTDKNEINRSLIRSNGPLVGTTKPIQSTQVNQISMTGKGTQDPVNKVRPEIRKDDDGVDVISLHNTQTEDVTTRRVNSDVIPTEFNNTMNTQNQSNSNYLNTTEYLTNLSNTEANRLMSDYNNGNYELTDSQNQQGGNHTFEVGKPTVVNFYADWCGFSRQFMPNWEKVRDSVKKKYGERIQLSSLNVGQDTDKVNISKSAGVNGYPTVVIFKDGNTYHKVAGNASADDIVKFIDETMSR
ncbi:thioredoxin [Acanthamoeba polyphaga mimivirus]|uniref:Thioredoxin n=1 Tax=Acanthamoeba polyphaga mimivirus Kroon TaxID=3069720 RepID=A0A0G2YAI5_9VIRU|nr:thioredoxin [Acanthamoeba polyphaga mimivirus]AKI80096.1 thioredoxin [Acanthamoeba polyphaga mimivirus Kroon]